MANEEPTRIRVQFYHQDAVELIQCLSPKHRSQFVEMAVIAWLKTPGGNAAAEALLFRGNKPGKSMTLVSNNTENTENEPENQKAEAAEDSPGIKSFLNQKEDSLVNSAIKWVISEEKKGNAKQ